MYGGKAVKFYLAELSFGGLFVCLFLVAIKHLGLTWCYRMLKKMIIIIFRKSMRNHSCYKKMSPTLNLKNKDKCKQTKRTNE